MSGPRARLYLSLFVAIAVLFAAGVTIRYGSERLLDSTARVASSHALIDQIRLTVALVKHAESAQRGFLLTGDTQLESEYYETIPEIHRHLDTLRATAGSDAAAREQVEALASAISDRVAIASDILRRYRDDGFASAQEELRKGAGLTLMGEIGEATAQLQQREVERLREHLVEFDRDLLVLQWVSIGGIAVGGGILLLVFIGLLHENRERRRAEHDATAASARLSGTVRRLEAATAETRELSRYAGLLQSCRAVEEALALTADSAGRLLPGFGGCVYLLSESRDLIERVHQWGDHRVHSRAAMAPADCWALRRGRPHRVEDVRSGGRCAHVDAAGARGVIGTLCVPIVAQGEALGLVYLSGDAAELDSEREEICVAVVEQLGLALSNLRLQETLRTQSIRDPLTGLFNRRYLMESMQREIARSRRHDLPLAVVMIDIDHFKPFNDTHGHDGGDAMLVQFARLLQTRLRSEDIACRYGGEEFTLILPETDPDSALRRAEEIRVAAAGLQVRYHNQPLSPITISAGVATWPADGLDPETLIRHADQALYRAKRGGRNRVEAT